MESLAGQNFRFAFGTEGAYGVGSCFALFFGS
jgi:hypothetical protein